MKLSFGRRLADGGFRAAEASSWDKPPYGHVINEIKEAKSTKLKRILLNI